MGRSITTFSGIFLLSCLVFVLYYDFSRHIFNATKSLIPNKQLIEIPEHLQHVPAIINYNYESFLINAAELCVDQQYDDQRMIILFVITNLSRNHSVRKFLRHHWAKDEIDDEGNRYISVYVMGKPQTSINHKRRFWDNEFKELNHENDDYQDMILGDFIEARANLTYKTMFGLNWVNTHCRNVDYIVKVDDDVLVRRENLVSVLDRLPKKGVAAGECLFKAQPVRDPNSKYFVTKEEFSKAYYPPYCKGHAMIFTPDVVADLVQASKRIKSFRLDDVYLGMLLQSIDVKVINLPEVRYTVPNLEYCTVRDLAFIHPFHILKMDEYLDEWKQAELDKVECGKIEL